MSIKRLALWFICFGLSFLADENDFMDQGNAFIFFNLIVEGLRVIIGIIKCISKKTANGYKQVITLVSFQLIILFTTGVSTELFDVDYDVSYMIMTFGYSLRNKNSHTKKSSEKKES